MLLRRLVDRDLKRLRQNVLFYPRLMVEIRSVRDGHMRSLRVEVHLQVTKQRSCPGGRFDDGLPPPPITNLAIPVNRLVTVEDLDELKVLPTVSPRTPTVPGLVSERLQLRKSCVVLRHLIASKNLGV